MYVIDRYRYYFMCISQSLPSEHCFTFCWGKQMYQRVWALTLCCVGFYSYPFPCFGMENVWGGPAVLNCQQCLKTWEAVKLMQFEYAEDTVKRPDSICPRNIKCNIQIWSHVRLLGEITIPLAKCFPSVSFALWKLKWKGKNLCCSGMELKYVLELDGWGGRGLGNHRRNKEAPESWTQSQQMGKSLWAALDLNPAARLPGVSKSCVLSA